MAAKLTAYIVVAIVAVTLIAGLIVGAQREDASGPVDLIIYNARVYPADRRDRFAEALAIRGSTILRVGSNREIKRLARKQTVVLDAHGGAVLPGFNDSHLHLLSGGVGLWQVNLRGAATLHDIQTRIRVFADEHPDAPWVIGGGWSKDVFPAGLPVRQQLDAVVADRPVAMTSLDGRLAWVNTKALRLAAITRRTPEPAPGLIVKDPRGLPTGVLKEAAQDLLTPVLPAVSREERLDAIRAAIVEAHRAGITSVQTTSGNADEFALYEELRREGELTLRIYSAVTVAPGFTEHDADAIEPIRRQFLDDPLFKVGAVALVTDSTTEARAAGLVAPPGNLSTGGQPHVEATDLKAIVRVLDRRGWQILTHAVGNGSARQALDAYAAASEVNQKPARGRRHRLEDVVDALDAADLPRLGALGVIAATQPARGGSVPHPRSLGLAGLDPGRDMRDWGYRDVIEAGSRLAFGSDWPNGWLDPILGIQAAVTATAPNGTLPLSAAIDAYTRDAAYASFDEHRKGTLAPGMLADVVILSTDIFELPPERLTDAVVQTTIFDGRVIYSRESAETTEP